MLIRWSQPPFGQQWLKIYNLFKKLKMPSSDNIYILKLTSHSDIIYEICRCYLADKNIDCYAVSSHFLILFFSPLQGLILWIVLENLCYGSLDKAQMIAIA